MLCQVHISDNVRPHRSGAMSQPGAAKARMEFLGDRAATNTWSAFQYEGLKSRLGQIKCGDQAVVSSPEDYDVARLRHR